MRIVLWVILALFGASLSGCGYSSEIKNDPLFNQGEDVYSAAMTGDLESTAYYMNRGGFDPQVANYQGILPLCAAAKGGNVEIIWMMVNEGADVNAVDQTGKTPLQYAMEAEHEAAVAYLKELGAVEQTE